jgi:predicted phage terminase large subunit-like protein
VSDLLTREELKQYSELLETVPEGSPQAEKVWQLLKAHKRALCRESFLPFVKEMWAAFIAGKHHKIMADAFERVARGELKRLIINMPPRHTKSEFASFLFPAWYLGMFPEKKIIQTAHTAELAVGFGRKVRNLVGSSDYSYIFPTKLSADSKAAGRWNTNKGGDYFAIGVGGAVTGKGADVLIIDDPHSEQEAMQGNPSVYDRVYEWYSSGPRQRLQPGGSIVIVMCMTGDTPVLMADGTEKPLSQICVGDLIATYENEITSSRVTNFQSNGVDDIFTIKTQSDKILRANERHPFLVDCDGERKWIRLKDLRPGMSLVATKNVNDQHVLKTNPGFAPHASQESRITAKTLMHRIAQSVITASGMGLNAVLTGATRMSQAVAYVPHTTAKNTHQKNHRKMLVNTVSKVGMESLLISTTRWFCNATIDAMYAVKSLLSKTPGRTGMGSYALTTAMTQGGSEDFYATTATLQLDTGKLQTSLKEPLSTYEIILDQIVDIYPSGREEVFDLEVERTENFIANGVVSHNTRWSKKDLTGQILTNSAARDGDEWEVIELPAILPSGNPLWPEFWKQDELEAIRAELPVGKWEAQYQQNPTSEEGAIIKRDMWSIWEDEKPPYCDYIIQSWDTAFERNNRADYSACTTWGIFHKTNSEGFDVANIILLDAFKDRMEFPELKQMAYDMWKEWNPDTLIVEKKAAGAPLIYEMRKMGIPMAEYTPSKGSDKIARVNAISDLFASGLVWCPNKRWAEEVMEELASFPNGDHDDLVDSTSQALLRFRQGGFIQIPTDEPDNYVRIKRPRYY